MLGRSISREEEKAEALCHEVYGASIEEIYEDDDELVYYTEWDEEEEIR